MNWDKWNFSEIKKNQPGGKLTGYPQANNEESDHPLYLLLVDDECLANSDVEENNDKVLSFCKLHMGMQNGKCPVDQPVTVFYTDDFNLTEDINKNQLDFDGIVQDLLLNRDEEAPKGLENLDRLRGNLTTPHPGVIVVTQHSDPATREATKGGLPFHFAIAKRLNVNSDRALADAEEINNFFNYCKFHQLLRISPLSDEYKNFVGVTTLKKVYDFLEILKRDRELPVVILGETGTGKELVARLIHAMGCKEGVSFDTFVPILTGTIGDGVAQGELEGIEELQGSRKINGYLRDAENGTAFFDELGDMTLSMQARLLRFLQEKEVHPIGGERVTVEGVRCVFATNADVEELYAAGEFREDFLQRIDGLTIRLPSLAERKDEHKMLIEHFFVLADVQKVADAPVTKAISTDLMNHLLDMCENGSFTGNVRQLDRVIRRLVLVAPRGKPVGMDAYDKAMQYLLLQPGKPVSTIVSDVKPLAEIFGTQSWNEFFANPDRRQNGHKMRLACDRGFQTEEIVTWLIEQQLASGNHEFLDSEGNSIVFANDSTRIGKLSSLYTRSEADWIKSAKNGE